MKDPNPISAKTHLCIILSEYLLVFLTTLLWRHVHGETGILPAVAYGMYLFGNILVLMASCVQIVLLVWTSLGRLSHPPAAWIRVLLCVLSYFCGIAVAYLFQRELGKVLF